MKADRKKLQYRNAKLSLRSYRNSNTIKETVYSIRHACQMIEYPQKLPPPNTIPASHQKRLCIIFVTLQSCVKVKKEPGFDLLSLALIFILNSQKICIIIPYFKRVSHPSPLFEMCLIILKLSGPTYAFDFNKLHKLVLIGHKLILMFIRVNKFYFPKCPGQCES